MPAFSYKARSAAGTFTEGLITAPEQKAAIEQLRNQKLTVVEITEKAPSTFDGFKKIFKAGVKTKEIVIFSRQLSTLTSAGVPLVQGLTVLEDQAESVAFKQVIRKVREDIEAGFPIAEALKKHPTVFTELYVGMVKAGELGGILDTILERLSKYLEEADELRGKVKGALTYPAVVILIAGGVTIFLLVGVIPTFKEIFSSFGHELPAPTRMLINLSDGLKRHLGLVLACPFVLFFCLKRFRKTAVGAEMIDRLMLKLPVFGLLLKKVAVAKFTRTFGTLIKSGVPILQTLETVAKTSGNKVIEKAIREAQAAVRDGERIAGPLKKSGIFPSMVIQMIAIGEETGNLDSMLNKIADFYDQEVDVAVKALTSMIEPIIIVIMGLVIGSIVIAMFMPMFEMGSLAGG
jgi:type IV pilus assembly protein PilC